MEQTDVSMNAAPAPAPAPAPKKGGGVTAILCVVFALVAIGLGVYIAVDKMGASDGDKKPESSATSTDEEKVEETAVNSEKGYVQLSNLFDVYGGLLLVTKNGDVYYDPAVYETNNKVTVQADGIGESGTFNLKYADFYNWSAGPGPDDMDRENLVVKGYKLDLQNIVSVEDAHFGHQDVQLKTVLIDKDGNLSTLVGTYDYATGKTISFKLNKNVESNVRSITVVSGDAYDTVIHYLDGSTKKADYKKLGFSTGD